MPEPVEIRLVGKDDSGKALADAEEGILGVGKAGEKASKGLKGFDDGIKGVGQNTRKAGKETDEYATRLDRAGDAGGNAESQFLGLGAGISGTTTLMKGGSLSAEEYAMAVADIGDSVEHTVVPWIGKAKDVVVSFTDKIGGMKGAAIGAAGAAGIGALIYAAKELEAMNQAKVLDEMAEGFQAVDYAATSASMQAIRNVESIGMLDEAFNLAEMSGGRNAEKLIDLAEAAGVSADVIQHYRDEIDQAAAAEKNSTAAVEDSTSALRDQAEAIRGVNDERRKAIDPLFGMLDALEGNRDAQRQVNDADAAYVAAVKEHGRGSAEAEEALRNLNTAQDDAVRSAYDYESAASDLEAQIKEHPASLSNAKLALERWVAQGSISAEQARRMAIRFDNAASAADGIEGNREARLSARDNASAKVQSVGNQLSRLDGREATVYITGRTLGASVGQMLSLLSQARVAGGPVSAAAGGGPRGGGPLLVGEGGPELLYDVSPGSMVKDAATTRRMLGADTAGRWGGSPVFVFGGNPTDMLGRALFDWFRDTIRDDHGGDVQRGLGWG